MGIFSEIGKAFKSVFKGIAKVFAPVLKPLGKLMGSAIGKAIMLAVTIFTMGAALMAGGGAFFGAAPGTSFIGRFVEAGQAFMNTLMGKGGEEAAKAGAEAGAEVLAPTAEALAEGSNIASQGAADALLQGGGKIGPGGASTGGGTIGGAGNLGTEAMQAGSSNVDLISQGMKETAGGLPDAGGMGGLLEGGKEGMLEMAKGAGKEVGGLGAKTAAQADKGWLSRAAKSAKDFISTEGGGRVAGKVIGGIGLGMAAANRDSSERRYDRMWRDPNNPGIRQLDAQNYDSVVDAGRGIGASSAAGGNRFIRSTRRTPTVPFRN